MDKIERLKIFCLVAEKQSFAQAALQLGLPRSNVTYAIQALEKEYEVLLFYRTTRKVALTHEGSLFYQEAMRLVTQLKELNRFKTHVRSTEGKISIGMPKRLATQLLIPHLGCFYQRYPKVKVLVNGSDDFSNLIEQQLDCVVRVGQVQDQYLLIRPITQTHIWTLAAPAYLAEFGEPKSVEELQQHYAVDYHVAKHYREWSELVFRDQRLRMPYRLLIENTEAYIQAGLAGIGIIQIPEFDAAPYVRQGVLQRLFVEVPDLQLPVNILLTDRQYRPQYFQDFIDWLEELLKQQL
ncbi:LysR family transcriptional regulator [Acinetobacter courvalinii]|uniref:LysR family transcriptional regulator n=1 Tax=Acinetobacter courvalinii TaxID=280147 RepID=UPI0021CEFB9D|nr:LysR family transcriptional regulator [Acinetobacter courvalinii]MCU4368333.1 LysR family transcriptional regulator [Acinetobacter courvalinii]MCU4446703.1 LysR family transcriptional regulator [Acinetobacter courvalinii]